MKASPARSPTGEDPIRGAVNILTHVEQLNPDGGEQVNSLHISRELAKRGHRIDLVYTTDGAFAPEYREFCHSLQQVPPVDLSLRSPVAGARNLLGSVRASVRSKPDVIYNTRFFSLEWAAATHLVTRAPVVCHAQGDVGGNKSRERVRVKLARDYIPVSRYVAGSLRQLGVDDAAITVVHNGVDPDLYPFGGEEELYRAREVMGIDRDAIVVLYYGRLDPIKGIEVLLESFTLLSRHSDRMLLVIQGAWKDNEAYFRRLQALAPPGGVRWMRRDTDVVTPLHAADVVVCPSVWQEPFGRVIIEALSTGRPIVATGVGGIPEILTGELARLLVAPGDPTALAEKLIETHDWRSTLPGLGMACRRHVEGHFTQSQMVDGIEEVMERAVRRRSGGPR